MHRRELLRILGAAAAAPALGGLAPERLLALARETHARVGPARGSAARLRAFDQRQVETVATIAELIIPATDTPGARDAGVAEFIDLIVAEWYDADERERFLEGIAGVDARSRTTFGAAFTALSHEEQVALLRGLDAEVAALRDAAAAPEGDAAAPEDAAAAAGLDVAARRDAAARLEEVDPDDHFFAQMKWLTLYGYYTSEVGVNEELEYVMIPGRFDPCAATGLRPEPEGR